ncbi:glycerol dehydrogenase [Martelella radicis]|uniref:Glycerol dehydrogenase n=1 Tax=Martelella radicis TaxID=1397476 RepID=A0A7W6KMY2_9HYPH|nr:glycerol dehydrogenase [Martelella radicis]MBB4122795.1 glycerol dehydrogenase [Martelella radicis]
MISTTIFPGRYVQGADAIGQFSAEIARLGTSALAIVDKGVTALVGDATTTDDKATIAVEAFNGECSDEEIARIGKRVATESADVIAGIGGGKALDTAKAVAHAAGLPVVIVPTLASTDAPCSALSVIYTAEGAFKRYLVLPKNPDVVLVDTQLIVGAPVRLFVAGMGDALSTWFEAEDCRHTQSANMTGRVGSMTAYGLARMCFDTLLADGAAAKAAASQKIVTPEFERVVEANTLLSGLGFESGGLSGAHAIHNGLTALPGTHAYWHGEKVAIGTQALVMLTKRPREIVEAVYGFSEAIGLPMTLADIGIGDASDADLLKVAKLACDPADTMGNVPGSVKPEDVAAAIRAADAEGRSRKAKRLAA